MKKEKGHPKAARNVSDSYYADLSLDAQRRRLLDALRLGPVTTIEARRNLDILMPAARVHELRHRYGLKIETVRVRQPTDCGKLHSIARYALLQIGERHE